MMAQSVAAKGATSNLPGKKISKVTWQKLRDNTINKTEFYDISQQSELLPTLKTGSTIHPRLETVEFYHGRRMSHDSNMPQSARMFRVKQKERESGYRKLITLENILENFKEGQISFVGQAGSGKTTLLKAITQQVIKEKYKNLSSIEVVHFVHLRTFKRNDLVTPAELLFRDVSPEMSDAELDEAMQYAKENPEKVLFIIDSLDTVPYTIDGVYTGITTDDRASPEAILFHLLSGNLLPGCRFITSSREYAIRNYKGDVRAKQVIALAGLAEESMRKIVVGYVGKEKAEEKMAYFKRKPVIESLCATPVWLIFTLMALSIESIFTPTTMAGILVVLLQNMIRSEHVHEGNIEVVGKLGKMAFTGTKEHRVEFSLDELGNFNLNASEIRDLVVAKPSGGYQKLILGDSILMYVHQCLQEILSAFHIAKMNLKEFEEFISTYIHKPHYAVVRRLLTGILLNNEVFENAENFLEDATDFEQKKKHYLKQSLSEQLKSDLVKEDLLELYMCLSEAGDGASDIILSSVDRCIFSQMTLSPSEMYAIGWVMSQQTIIKILDFSLCNLTQASLSTLYHALEGGNVQVHELDISSNKRLGPDEMTLFAKILVQCKVKVLGFSACQPKSDALKAFLDSSVGAKLHDLNISFNKNLGPAEMALIARILVQCRVQVLKLWECELKSNALKAFLNSSVGAKLDELDASRNDFGPDEMMVIAQICKQREVDRFRVCQCDFLSGALKSFLFHSVGAKISLLDIGGIKLHVQNSTRLGQIIKQCGVETLVTRRPTDLTSIDIEVFKVSSDNFKISKLECRNDDIVTGVADDERSMNKFLPYVAKEIILTDSYGTEHDIEMLQNLLDEGRNEGLKMIFKKYIYDKHGRLEQKVLELQCSESPAENAPSIVENRRAKLNNDGSITVSWHYPDEDPEVRYHVEMFCNDQPTGDIEICKDPYYQCKTALRLQVYAFRIWVVNSKGLAGTTMFTNEVLNRRLVISESLHKEVGSNGDHLTVGGCSAAFPRNSFSVSTPVALIAEIDSTKWPKDFLALTPTLYVNAQGLQERVCIRLPSWGVINEQNISTLRILHLPTGSNEWEDTGITLSFTNSSFLEFEWHDFSPVLGAVSSQNESVDYLVSGSIFTSEFNELSIAFYVTSDLVFKSVSDLMASQKPSKHLKLTISPFSATTGETVETAMNCHDPDFFLEPPGPFSSTVKNYFADAPEIRYTAISNNSQEEFEILLNLSCEIKKNANQIEAGSIGFTHMWKPKKTQQQYKADGRMREEVGSHDPSYHQRRRQDEASTSNQIGRYDQVPYDARTQGRYDPVLHPVEGAKRSYKEPTLYVEKRRRPTSPSEIPGSFHQAVHQQYRADDRVREEVGSHDPSYHHRRRRDEASTSTQIGHYDQVPYDIPEQRMLPKELAESSSGLPLQFSEDFQIQRTTPKEVGESYSSIRSVKKIHPSRNHDRSNQNQSRMSREEHLRRPVLEEAHQEYHPSPADPPHISPWREDESPSEAEKQILRDDREPAETSPMLTVAEIHPRQNFNSSNFDQLSTSRRVPQNTGGVMFIRQSEQYYGGLEGSSYQGYRQMDMGFQGFPNTGSRPFGLGMETAPKAIVDAEEARRQAPPPEITEPKLVLEGTKIRVSWDKVDDDRVTYCVNIYCNNQLINNTPMKTPNTEIEYHRLKPSCEYQCEVWTCNSRGVESGKTWSNAVNTPNTQESTPSEDESRGGRTLSNQLVSGQGASVTFLNSTIFLGGQQQQQSPEEKGKQGLSSPSAGLPEVQRNEECEEEVQEGDSDHNTGD